MERVLSEVLRQCAVTDIGRAVSAPQNLRPMKEGQSPTPIPWHEEAFLWSKYKYLQVIDQCKQKLGFLLPYDCSMRLLPRDPSH